jgi:hypothetical protein
MQILVAFINLSFSVKQLRVKVEVASEDIIAYMD